MNQLLAAIFLVFLPVCTALNCYSCASGMPGCNDPFDSTAYNVTTYSLANNTFCVKLGVTNHFISRYGSPNCVNTPFVLGIGMACCQTDLCNGAQDIHQISLLIALSCLIMLFKIY